MKKVLTLAVATFAAVIFASAENIKKTEEFHSFNSISVSNNFDITIVESSSYSADLTIDSKIIDYCKIYVQAGVLNLSVDEKSFPKELKSQLRGKNNIVDLKATIHVPAQTLSSLNLSDDAVLNVHGDMTAAKNFNITITDNATVKSMKLYGEQVSINASKKAGFKADIECENIQVATANNATVNIEVKAADADVKTEGSSQAFVNAKLQSCKSVSSAMSKLEFKGVATQYSATGSNFANINAEALEAEEVSVNINSCSCNVNATKKLNITLTSGAKLVFEGTPSITIDKIASSSVTKAADAKAKKR